MDSLSQFSKVQRDVINTAKMANIVSTVYINDLNETLNYNNDYRIVSNATTENITSLFYVLKTVLKHETF